MQRDLGNGQAVRRRVQDEGAGGMTVHRHRSPGLNYEGADIFDLTLDCVRRGVCSLRRSDRRIRTSCTDLRQRYGTFTGFADT